MFFALVPPLPLQQRLGELASEVARRTKGRPVPAANIHLTLAFIGAWPVARLALLQDIGARLDRAAIDLVLDALGGFRRAAVAWIGASQTPPQLAALASSLGALLAAVGIAADERPFHPHLTLARKCRRFLARERIEPIGWTADAVSLMQSETRADGARYRPLASWPLAPLKSGPLRPAAADR